MHEPAIIVLTASALPLAVKIKAVCGGEIHGLIGRVDDVDQPFENTKLHLQNLFSSSRTLIGIMASGALIRMLAPILNDKRSEPPVLAMSDDGANVVPLLGGHNGANQIARFLSEKLSAHAAVTTAGDIRFGVAMDDPPSGWTLRNSESAKTVMAGLLSGESVLLDDGECLAAWLRESALTVSADGKVKLTVTTEMRDARKNELLYVPKLLALGIGCERNASPDEAISLVTEMLVKAGLSADAIGCVVSIDVKADEVAVHAVAEALGVSARFFTADELEAQSARLLNPSKIVFKEVGCHGVAEGAALAAVGNTGALVVEKQKSKRVTAAVAKSETLLDVAEIGRGQGHLSVVGIGPGSEEWRSPEVSRMVLHATDLVGYSLYLDLLGPLVDGKTRHDFDLGKEEDRVRHAMELAGEGKDVALVCSGDAGIYAMATLVFELLENGGLSDAAKRIGITVSPGISALQAAAARAGAPLGHDFCTISLSDLLTPWEAIQTRVKAAAMGDFVIAFYNPVSKRRRTQLAYAKDVLLEHRPADTPVILATNLGREGELVRIVPLAELLVDDVDMLTVVIVGSSQTRVVKTGDGKSWVYTPRGYADKKGTRIEVGS